MNSNLSNAVSRNVLPNPLPISSETDLNIRMVQVLTQLLKAHDPEKGFPKSMVDECLPTPLTAREYEILQLVYLGKSNKQIAQSLFVSVNTIKTHLSNLYVKLDVNSRIHAIIRLREILLLSRFKMAS